MKIQPNMSEQDKKQKIYDLLNAETQPPNFQNQWNFFMASIKLRP